MLHFLPVTVPNEPQAPDQSQQRHDVGCESGEDRMRHGSALPNAGAFYEGKPPESLPAVVVGTFGTLADCDATATLHASVSTIPNANHPGIAERNIAHIPQVADHAQRYCVLTAPEADNSPDLLGMRVTGGIASPYSAPAGIDTSLQQTCDCCGGSGRSHFRVCSVCGGSGLVS